LDSGGHEIFRRPASGKRVLYAAGGLAIAMSDSSTLSASTALGSILWSTPIGASDGPIAATGTSVYATSGNALVAVTSSGRVQWRIETGPITAAQVTTEGLAIAQKGGNISMIAEDGAIAWSFAPDGGFAGGIGVNGTSILAGSASGAIYAIDARDGHERWTAGVGASVDAGPASIADSIVLGANGLYSLAPNASIAWADPARIASLITALGDSQAFVSDRNGLSGVIDSSGAFGWESRSFGTIAQSATSGSTLFVANTDGVIFAVK
jgi:outer membrane protein assembly factor BamB